MKRAMYIILGFCIAFGAIAQAQPPTFPGQMNRNDNNDNDRSQRARDFFTWQLIRTLDMDDEQSEQLLPHYYRFSRERVKVYARRQELVFKINTEVDDPTVEDDVLREYADQLKKTYEEENKLMVELLERGRKILDDRRYAKLVAFEENLKNAYFSGRR